MNTSRNIRIAVDDSDISNRAAAYVGDLIGARQESRAHLLYLLPPLPPALLEVGSEDPNTEQREEAWIRDRQPHEFLSSRMRSCSAPGLMFVCSACRLLSPRW